MKKILKKLEKRQKQLIKQFESKRDEILANPMLGETLDDDLKGYWKYGWKYRGIDLRICYKYEDQDNHIYFIYFGVRENF